MGVSGRWGLTNTTHANEYVPHKNKRPFFAIYAPKGPSNLQHHENKRPLERGLSNSRCIGTHPHDMWHVGKVYNYKNKRLLGRGPSNSQHHKNKRPLGRGPSNLQHCENKKPLGRGPSNSQYIGLTSMTPLNPTTCTHVSRKQEAPRKRPLEFAIHGHTSSDRRSSERYPISQRR